MNLVLKNKKTSQYIEEDGGWTSEHYEARVFGTGLEASLFCLEHDIYDMEIIGEFVDRRMNFTIPVTDLRDD
jgi:hypothetical protein